MKQLKRGITPKLFIGRYSSSGLGIYAFPERDAFNLPSLKKFSKLDLHPQVAYVLGG
ncbi:MAG: hypothetical protein R3C56_29725 [Pirellulaceae bacterium]